MKKTELYKRKALSYVERVISGERVAGELERLAVERYLHDMENATEMGFYFDERAAKLVFAFFTMLRHYKGEWAGREFELEDWQCFIIWNVFGWKTKDGRRRFNYANVEVARKNGKTTFAAGIALYMLVADGEAGSEVYSAAVDKDQAKICWSAAKSMVSQSKGLSAELQTFSNSITMESTASSYQPLSRESKNKDGLSPHCGICDEMHAWQTDEIYNLITTGMGARKNPLVFSITTAGANMTLPYYQMRRHYVNILKGIVQEENTFAIIYCPDTEDDWKNPETWSKANPNYGISVYPEYLDKEFGRALNMGSTTEVNFKTKNLNMWVDAPDVWIQDEKVLKCDHGTTDDELLGQICYAGLDLASHVDINALALYFPDLEVPAFRLFFWIPEGKVLQKEDRVDYRQWAKDGFIMVTPGDVIDIDYITDDLTNILLRYDVKNIAFDPAKAYHGVIQGLQKNESFASLLDEFSQGIQNMSEPTKRIEADVTAGTVDLMKNPVIRWMFRNVVIYRDPNDNIKLDKKRSIEKIDGVVAMGNAIGGYMSNPPEPEYTGLKTIDNFRRR
ncbi:MAG: terminase large subunit [Tannerella sp.]|jgi:phage terminase large subunit-like protein|nr:terminase large subunit [Tannerella sp.]